MRRRDTTHSQRGIAAMEVAIGLVFMVPLFMILVEGSSALIQYSKLQNAAMEGARMLIRDGGDTTGVSAYIKSIVSPTDTDATTVTISNRDVNNNVTVQVDHVFTTFFQSESDGQTNSSSLLGNDPLTLSAAVTVALPDAN